jgi:hypothetical protein
MLFPGETPPSTSIRAWPSRKTRVAAIPARGVGSAARHVHASAPRSGFGGAGWQALRHGWQAIQRGTGRLRDARHHDCVRSGHGPWTRRAPMPSPRADIAASQVRLNGQARIEVVGGSVPGTTCSMCHRRESTRLTEIRPSLREARCHTIPSHLLGTCANTGAALR